MNIETTLYTIIDDLFKEIKDMTPEGGFSSPRDIKLVSQVNRKSTMLNYLQEAMRVINPDFDIREGN